MKRKFIYPFSAIVGQERMKKALILNAVNPNLGGVLIRGEKGTGKSTAARALADLLPEIEVVSDCPFNCNPHNPSEMCLRCREMARRGNAFSILKRKTRVVDLPLGATEDRVVGTIDVEEAIKKGEKVFQPGLLAEVHRGMLYVDEVNLLDDHLVDVLLDTAAMGINYVEREGISFWHPSKFILIGTMNPEEGELRPQLLDRFGLCTEIHGLKEIEEREEVVRRTLEFEKNPEEFRKKWENEQKQLAQLIINAEKILPEVNYSQDILRLITQIALEMGVDGHRADIFMLKTAKTISAFQGRKEVIEEDVKEAAELVLPHRMRKKPFQEPKMEEKKIEEIIKKHENKNKAHTPQSTNNNSEPGEKEKGNSHNTEGNEDVKFESGDTFQVKNITFSTSLNREGNSGRRTKAKTNSPSSSMPSGKYVGSKIPEGKDKLTLSGIALDATIRASAPYQRKRARGKNISNAVVINSEDLRQKIREKKMGNTILFLVDSSGSMGVNRRMIEVKGAILSLLEDAYKKRDKVGLVAFKGEKAEIILPPTRSLERAKKELEELPVGGKTPLSQGLWESLKAFKKEMQKNKRIKPLLVLISDGRANVSMGKNSSPFKEAKNVAEEIKKAEIKSLVLDTETGFIKLGNLKEIARSLGAQYFLLEEIKAQTIVEAVKRFGEDKND